MKDDEARPLSQLFIALACAGLFFFVAGINAEAVYRGVHSYFWPKATGVVLSSSLRQAGPSLFYSEKQLRVAYKYRVGGMKYEGDKLCYGGALLPMKTFDASYAERAMSLTAGEKVPVYHHPRNHGVSVMNKGVRLSLVIELAVAGLVFLCGLNRWTLYLYGDPWGEKSAPLTFGSVDPRVVRIFKSHAERIRDLNSQFHIYPNIPGRRLANAIQSYAPGFSPEKETPLVLVDDTAFGSSRKGCLMTDKSLYGSDINPERRVALEELVEIMRGRDGKTWAIYLRNQRLQTLIIPSEESVTLFIEMIERIACELSGIPYEEDEEDDFLYVEEGEADPEITGVINLHKKSVTDPQTYFLGDIPRPLLENAVRRLAGASSCIGIPLILIDTTLNQDGGEGVLISDHAFFGLDDENEPVGGEISFISDVKAGRGLACSYLVVDGKSIRLNGYSKKNTLIIADIVRKLSVLSRKKLKGRSIRL